MLANASDEESSNVSAETRATGDEVNDTSFIHPQSSVFSWQDIVYDIEIKGESRRLLDHVSGWVKPGSLTALMGASGAGKTTLLDVLARRVKVGVISGETLANGKPLDWNFPRKIGYVQQQGILSQKKVRAGNTNDKFQIYTSIRLPFAKVSDLVQHYDSLNQFH